MRSRGLDHSLSLFRLVPEAVDLPQLRPDRLVGQDLDGVPVGVPDEGDPANAAPVRTLEHLDAQLVEALALLEHVWHRYAQVAEPAPGLHDGALALRIGGHARGVAVPCTERCKAKLFRMTIYDLVQQDFIPGIKVFCPPFEMFSREQSCVSFKQRAL